MASTPPDPHPDSDPQLPDEHPDSPSPAPGDEPGRESVEGRKSPLEDPGAPGGTAGTGDSQVQDSESAV